MPLVLDCSAIIPLALVDEDAAYAVSVLSALAKDEGIAPILFWYEVRNVLIINERRNRIAADVADDFLRELETLPIRLFPMPATPNAMLIARRHGLSCYDAVYLELAISQQAVMATLDARLATAARSEGLRVL